MSVVPTKESDPSNGFFLEMVALSAVRIPRYSTTSLVLPSMGTSALFGGVFSGRHNRSQSRTTFESLSALVVCVFLLSGCCELVYTALDIEPTPEVESPQTVVHGELTAHYPGNWRADTTDSESWSIESPGGGATVILTPSSPVAPEDLAEVLDLYLETYRQMVGAVGGAKCKNVRVHEETIAGKAVVGRVCDLSVSILNETLHYTFYTTYVSDLEVTLVTMLQNSHSENLRPGIDQVYGSLRLK